MKLIQLQLFTQKNIQIKLKRKNIQIRLKRVAPDIYKAVTIVVNEIYKYDPQKRINKKSKKNKKNKFNPVQYEWLKKFWEKDDLIHEFFVFLVTEYIPYRASKPEEWYQLAVQKKYLSLQQRVKWALQNFLKREDSRLRACARTLPDTVYLEDLSPRKAF